MNRLSLVTQVLMIGIAVAIVFLYIKPKVQSIRAAQDLTASYEEETKNVSQVNQTLRDKITQIDAVSPDDIAALVRFMPDTVDEIAVLKDLSLVLDQQFIKNYDIAYTGKSTPTTDSEEIDVNASGVAKHLFDVSFVTDYPQLKTLLGLLETNNYLMQVDELKIAEEDDGLLSINLKIATFSRELPVVEVTSE